MKGLWTSIMMRRSDRMWPCWLVSMMWRFFSTLRANERWDSFFSCTWRRWWGGVRLSSEADRAAAVTCATRYQLTSSTRLKPPIPRVQTVLKSLSDTLEKKSASACSLQGFNKKKRVSTNVSGLNKKQLMCFFLSLPGDERSPAVSLLSCISLQVACAQTHSCGDL